MRVQDNATEVTAAGIARLAGVGRAAVSNWRRRHADFPSRSGAPRPAPPSPSPRSRGGCASTASSPRSPLRERVWQQLVGHPEGPVAALTHAGCVLLLIHDRPTLWLEVSAGSDERLAAMLPEALNQVLTPRFVHPDGRVKAPESVNTPPTVHTPTAAPLTPTTAPRTPTTAPPNPTATPTPRRQAPHPARRPHPRPQHPHRLRRPPLGPLLRWHRRTGRRAGGPADLRVPARPAPGRQPPPVHAHPRRPGRPHGGPRRPPPAPSSTPPAAPAPSCAPPRRTAPPPAPEQADQRLYAQDGAPDLAALTGLRLALHTRAGVRAAAGDTLRADAFPELRADAVLCHPPFNERNWGHDELAYDARWEYGFPARTESELAWVQHALARLRDGGTAVLLMPPAAASRRSGRRIRADLLRRGALRAVVALPVGAAPPYNIPLHLWVLRRPEKAPAQPEVLLADVGQFAGEGRGGPDWRAVRDAVLDAWRGFDRVGRLDDRPGLARSLPVIELLDDDVDLAPARHLPPPALADGAGRLTDVRERLDRTLRLTADLTPEAADTTHPAPRWPLTAVGELARGGALVLRTGGNGGHARVPVLTDHDVLAGTGPSGTLPESEEEAVLTEPGDVVVPVLGGGSVARVIDDATAGAALGRSLVLLRPDPTALDPWFLAGFLRGTANNRQASSYASTATRLDVRRLQLPRLPLDAQHRYGARFRALDEFERALRLAGRLGEQLVRGMYDGLTDGTVAPGR